MKTQRALLLAALVIGTTASSLLAQESQPPQGGRPPQGNQQGQPPKQGGQGNRQGQSGGSERGPGGPGGQRPPLVTALDANGDHVIDAAEIANASAALKKLDKNGDGKLTEDELMPRHPGGQGGPGSSGQGGGGAPGQRPKTQ